MNAACLKGLIVIECCQHGGRSGRVLHAAGERPETEADVHGNVHPQRHQLSSLPVRRPLPQRHIGRPQLLGLRDRRRGQGSVPGLSTRLLLHDGRELSRYRRLSVGPRGSALWRVSAGVLRGYLHGRLRP